MNYIVQVYTIAIVIVYFKALKSHLSIRTLLYSSVIDCSLKKNDIFTRKLSNSRQVWSWSIFFSFRKFKKKVLIYLPTYASFHLFFFSLLWLVLIVDLQFSIYIKKNLNFLNILQEVCRRLWFTGFNHKPIIRYIIPVHCTLYNVHTRYNCTQQTKNSLHIVAKLVQFKWVSISYIL